ncbi:MAG TPA: acyltransferase [Dokdonella sp.]|uniref:acyltransferase n=1 Tax=Dokdonella sp. TaxID=2291710 RepID=UPI002C12B619|nr:acyltransferase [Dokdonella sp.]HUD43809.1 acyltransferase [Dokdonella sp.]
MRARLRQVLTVSIASILIAAHTFVHASTLFVLALLKFVLPIAPWRRGLSRALVAIAENWIAVNSALMASLGGTRIEVDGLDGLRRDEWYLVLCNHQSWVDIPVLQSVFNRRIPFMRFFLKRELIWVPVLGLAWWALDFPFMRRYSRAEIERRPELRGKDIEATRRACERYRELPVSVMNFVEGTRFTPAKHAASRSAYRHLLPPRAGGVAFVLETMGDLMQAVLDVTVIYPQGRPSVTDLLSGRVRQVRVVVRRLAVPRDRLDGGYERDPQARARFQDWINALWRDKDATIEAALNPS